MSTLISFYNVAQRLFEDNRKNFRYTFLFNYEKRSKFGKKKDNVSL